MAIVVDIDVMLARRKMAVGTLAERIGITPANLAVLRNGRAGMPAGRSPALGTGRYRRCRRATGGVKGSEFDFPPADIAAKVS